MNFNNSIVSSDTCDVAEQTHNSNNAGIDNPTRGRTPEHLIAPYPSTGSP
jgi:hypothetical protein